MRLIDGDALIDKYGEWYVEELTDIGYIGTIKRIVDSMPTIKPEQKKGEWIANGDIPKECPFCGEDWDKYVFGEVWYTGELPKFCPNCGEDMREGEKE